MELNIKVCDILLYEKINEYSSIIFEKNLILIFVHMIFFLVKLLINIFNFRKHFILEKNI